jgi:TonB-linked SusC/RagA family outer membrane protein
MNAKINDWMNVGFESFITSSNYSGASPSVKTAFYLQPWAPIKDDKGELVLYPEGSMLNPYTTLNVKDSDKRLNIFGNFHAEIKLPIKGLNYRINYAQNYRTANHDNFNPYEESLTGAGYKYSSIEYDWTVDNILTFIRTFNDVHSINATFLYGVEKRNGSSTDARAQNFLNGSLGYNRLQAGDPALNSITTGAWKETSLYSMGRVIYNLHNKYLITGTVRRDGFSGFGTKNKIGVFPSIAIGWIISEESYAQTFSWLNYLKLRSSYGSTGRRSVGRYDTMAKLSSAPSRVFGDGGNTTFGQYISSMENDELGWETTTGLNLGADFSIINSRIFGNIEYFSNKTKDILYDVQLPTLTGFSSTATNIGEVENHGLEFSVTGQVIRSKDFKWDMTFNFSRVRNKIVSILGSDNDGDGVEDDLVANGLFIGEPQQVIYDYEIIGMWQLDDETAGAIPAGFFPGTYKIADLSGPDGTPDGAYSAAYDKKILGYADPSYRFSISNKVSYKNFSLYMLINSVQGGKKYYFGDDSPYSSVYWSQKEQLTYVNGPAGAWDYWMPENPDAKYRRLDTSSAYAPRPYSQRNFIRLQDVSLSYSFNKSAIQKLDIENCKIFISGQNLVTITKWKGWDPETGRGFAPGMPLMRSYTIGLNVEF